MSDSNDEDSIQINTINQNEYSLKLAKKKEKLNESRVGIKPRKSEEKNFKSNNKKVLI
jgi:hypothetical protein